MAFQESGHWYSADGTPCHTQKCGPKAKNPTRPTTIRDAKKLQLFPSVTSVLGVLAKPQLERWKFRQITDWCWNASDEVYSNEEGWFKDAMEGAFERVQDAADAGTLIHAALESVSRGEGYDKEQAVYLPELGETVYLWRIVEPVIAWFEEMDIQPIAVEKCIVNKEHGFAGMADLIANTKNGPSVIDFKTRKTNPKYPCTPYDGQPMQIAAYAKTEFDDPEIPPVGCNLYISTTEIGRVEASWYGAEQVESEFKAFTHLCEVWRHLKGYDPRTKGGES